MATWQKEIMKLANDFCLNMEKVREIVASVNTIPVPIGKNESEYKYDRAQARIRSMIMDM